MSKQIVKPSILPGFMELLPSDQISFNWMMDIIRKNYEKFGFVPIDTPIIEKSEILLAKGGGDTEKQIYRFLKGETDMSLRFDLTVPLARYVAQHFADLTFPFRRYHIGKVYRGERNQKGRFREFYQCDIDIIGNGNLSIINDAEIPSVIYETFRDLGFNSFTIHINNRKVLNGFFEAAGVEDKSTVLKIIDKMDKIGVEAVREELSKLSISNDAVYSILNFIKIKGNNDYMIESLKALNIDNETFKEGLEELSKVVQYIRYFNVPEKNFAIDLTVARGLDYYTGTVYETILDDYPSIGSVCSGGRYDNLAEYYTSQKLPGVGISIGLTRLFYQLREAAIIDTNKASTLSQVLIIPLDNNLDYPIKIASSLRTKGIPCEVYFDDVKIAKKFGYADKLAIPFVISIGQNEISTNTVAIKNMSTGEQCQVKLEEAVDIINRK